MKTPSITPTAAPPALRVLRLCAAAIRGMAGIWIGMGMGWDANEHASEVCVTDLPFEVGALYNRRTQIHDLLGGQRQGGISTPKDHPVVIAFTGEAGKSHGYDDFWDDDRVFHYYGEGQSGDMQFVGGNRAIRDHQADGKKLLLFQMMGRGKPYRYLGEFLARTPSPTLRPRGAPIEPPSCSG